MLLPFFLLVVFSLILSLIFTPLVRMAALRWKLVDVPDNQRKVHKRPIPRVGGIAVAAAYFSALIAIAAWFHVHSAAHSSLAAIQAVLPAAVVIFGVGLADDIFDLKPKHKFAGQIVAAAMAVLAGVHGPPLPFAGLAGVGSMAGMAVSLLWLVLCTNAINLIDGLDGLAGGVSFLATIAILIASLMAGDQGLALATAPLAAALLGFLIYNFNPASIFLGDCGSLLLGFLLGCYTLLWQGSAHTGLDSMAPLMVLAVPILDVTLAICRRFLRCQPIFKADRSHIHHRLLARGFSHRNTVLLLYVAAATASSLALTLVWARDLWEVAVVAAFAAFAIFGIRQLGYAEFDALRMVVLRGGLRTEVTAHLAMQSLKAGLEAAPTADDCWALIRGGCEEFGFRAIGMQLAGSFFDSEYDSSSLRPWAMRIPISNNEWVELSQNAGPVRYPTALVSFVTLVRHVLADKSTRWVNRNIETAGYASALYGPSVSAAS